jgi:Tfp pilus assembly protein PilV
MKILFPFTPARRKAFSLLEVMIAIGILFLATFAILGLVSSSLANARRLQRPMVDASALLSQLSLTNKLVEGTYSGNLGDALGRAYADYRWTGEITEVASNKLFQADFIIQPANGGSEVISRITTLFYRPQSLAGSMEGGNFIHR